MTDPVQEMFEDDSEEVVEVKLDPVDVESKGSSIDMADDYNFVREKLIRSIVRGSEIIDKATVEVKTAPTARAVEAASGAVKTLTDVSKSLIDLHEKIRNIEANKIRNNQSIDDDETIPDDAGIILKTTLSDLLDQIKAEEEK